MKEENKTKLKELLKEYLKRNDLFLKKEIFDSKYRLKQNDPRKEKQAINDYQLNYFMNDFELGLYNRDSNYLFWKYVYQQNTELAEDMIKSYIKFPKKEYECEEYIDSVLKLYTKDKKENKILWLIINTKQFLNKNIKKVEKLFEDDVLSHKQKQELVSYYINYLDISDKFNTLENKRIISILNEKLIKPIEINLIKEKELKIKATTKNCVYFEVKIEELMQYSLQLTHNYCEYLLENFSTLLPKVVEAETTDIIPRIIKNKEKIEVYHYSILTSLSNDLIENIFKEFVDSYIKAVNEQNSNPSLKDCLDCLKFAVIKSRKEKMEYQFPDRNLKGNLNKI